MLVADELLPGARPGADIAGESRLQAGFTVAMMLKDLKLAQEAASVRRHDAARRGSRGAVRALMARADTRSEDFSGIIRFLRGQ